MPPRRGRTAVVLVTTTAESAKSSFLGALRALPEHDSISLVHTFLDLWIRDGDQPTRLQALQGLVTALNAVAARQTRAGRGRPPRVPPAVGGAGKKRGRKKGRVGGGGGSGDGGDNDDDEGTDGSGNGDESRGGDQEPGDGDGGGGENEHGHGHGGGQESPPAGTASERGNNSRGGDRFADGDANGSRGQEPGAGDERDGGNSPAGTNDDGGGNDDGGADGGTNEDGDRNRDQEPLDGDEDGGDGIGGVEDGNEAGNDNGDGGGIDNERENDPGDSGINDDDDADNTPDRQPSESPGPRDNDGDENQQHTQPDLTPDPIQQQPAARDSDLEHGAAGSDPASSIREDNQNPSTPKRQSAGTQQPSASPPTPPESQSRHHQPTCEDLGPDDEVNAPSPKSPIQRPLPGPIGLPTPPTSARRQQLPSADTPLTSNPPADSSLGPNHSPPPPESTMSRALVPAPPEHIRRQLQIAASSPTPAVSPTTQQAAHVHRRNGRPTVQLQSATHRLVNDSTSGSASNHRVVGQTVINHAVRNLPDGPLRLGAPHIDDSALSYTLNQISNLPDILTLSPRHKETLGRFVLSFFAPDSWWTLRNIMCKVVASTGFRNTERLEPNQPTTEPGSEKPQCVQDYIESWHQQRVVCQKTADPAITTMLKMNNEMQLYIYWCRLQRVWLTTRDDRDRDHAVQEDSSSSNSNDCLGGEEANISSEQEAELIKFFDHEVEQRERSLGKAIRIRSVALLKSLIAPYLGYSFPLEAEATAGRGSATKKMFQTLWSKSNVRGKEYYILRRNLGWGAFAIAKTSYLNTLGSKILSQILPIVHANHPYLREMFGTIYDTFIYPITWGSLLLYQDIGSFIHIKSKSDMIQVCKKHPNGLKGVFESAGRRIPASVQREEESTATTDTATAATSASNVQNVEMPDANMPEEEDGFDIKELLDQEHSTDLAEDEYMIPPGSEGKKRMAVVEAAGKVARGMKRREMNQEEESSNIG